MTNEHGPGIAWLSARTGKDSAELLASPATAMADAVRGLATLASQADSIDPRDREAAESELASLREEIAAAPPPPEAFLKTLAGALRHTAERLKNEDS